VACYTEGFSHFATSMTAPVASGWSVSPVGLALLESAAFHGHVGAKKEWQGDRSMRRNE
jgi:hypothetical protein